MRKSVVSEFTKTLYKMFNNEGSNIEPKKPAPQENHTAFSQEDKVIEEISEYMDDLDKHFDKHFEKQEESQDDLWNEVTRIIGLNKIDVDSYKTINQHFIITRRQTFNLSVDDRKK